MTLNARMSIFYRKSFSVCRTHSASYSSRKSWILPKGHNTGIQVYNSATKSKVPLILKHPNYASWYICGPTVYDSAHIGHACSYVKLDIIRRILLDYYNINVVLAMNITDIDDKIIIRAARENQDINALTRLYEAEFFKDMERLNVKPPTVLTRVSEFVPRIIAFIQRLVAGNHAYVTGDGSVYFDTASCPTYGKFAVPPRPDEKIPLGGKRQAADFALWKAAKAGELSWESPWPREGGRGRPGWHIECSVMASAVFGTSVDLHSGGIDLLFPHHENEEAQCCSHHEVDQWVNYWLHTGHLHVKGDGVKMSKSLHNTVSIGELLNNYTADEFRVFCLMTKYRHGVEFTDSTMENAVAICRKIESFISQSDAYIHGRLAGAKIDEPALLQSLVTTEKAIAAHLANDFDTAKCMTAILELIATANRMLLPTVNSSTATPTDSLVTVAAVAGLVRKTMGQFGAVLTDKQVSGGNSGQLAQVLDCLLDFRSEVRSKALEQKQTSLLQSCDSLRVQLAAAGVTLKDHGKLSSWSYSGEQR